MLKYLIVYKAVLLGRVRNEATSSQRMRGTGADYLYERHITHGTFEVFLKKVMVSLLSISGI